jgi:hypothetical protein
MLSVYVLIKVHALTDYSVCMRLHQAFHCIAMTTRKKIQTHQAYEYQRKINWAR